MSPVYCDHKNVKPPKGTPKDRSGRFLILKGALPSSVVTAPWCTKDHQPDAKAA